MLGSTPPWAMVTPDSCLFSSSSFLKMQSVERHPTAIYRGRGGLPDGELEVPGDDARLLVVPGGVPGELEDLRGEVLHHGGHVDGSAGAHPLGVVAFPVNEELDFFVNKNLIPSLT